MDRYVAENSNQPGDKWPVLLGERDDVEQIFKVLERHPFLGVGTGIEHPIAITIHYPSVTRKITKEPT